MEALAVILQSIGALIVVAWAEVAIVALALIVGGAVLIARMFHRET